MSPFSDWQRILTLAPMEYGIARDVVRGVRAYAVQRGQWVLRNGLVPPLSQFADISEKLQPHGAIIFASTRDIEDAATRDLGVPIVNVSAKLTASSLPRVVTDNHAVGRQAAAHLLRRGFTHFAYAGLGDPAQVGFLSPRQRGFVEAITEPGHTCTTYHVVAEELQAWLLSLPKPIGIFTSDDRLALRLIDHCQALQLPVPEQVAVVGVDNDEYLCESGYVAISSVDVRGYEVGFQAAQLLDRLMQGQAAPTEDVIVPPGEVVTRRSTDSIAVSDPDLAFAIQYIREHACDPLRVDDLMNHLAIARRTLEKRFKAEFGRTLHAEIRDAQLQRAKELLATTTLRIPEVAQRSGFCDRHAFSRVFRDAVGQPPGAYREAFGRA